VKKGKRKDEFGLGTMRGSHGDVKGGLQAGKNAVHQKGLLQGYEGKVGGGGAGKGGPRSPQCLYEAKGGGTSKGKEALLWGSPSIGVLVELGKKGTDEGGQNELGQ